MKWINSLFITLFFSPAVMAFGFLDNDGNFHWVDHPQPKKFSVCFNHSCAETTTIGISEADWQRVQALFKPQPESAF